MELLERHRNLVSRDCFMFCLVELAVTIAWMEFELNLPNLT